MKKSELPSVHTGCGQCDNCRYLKHMRPEFVTCLIAPGKHEKLLQDWDKIQVGRPCTAVEVAR